MLPLVVSMSLPMVISMAVNALYNIIDSYFIANISEDAMTALSLVFPIQNLINACVAFCLGAQNNKLADKAATQGVFFSMIHGILLTVLCLLGTPVFLSMFTSDTEIIEAALAYADRVFLFCPVVTLGIGFEKIFQAVGNRDKSLACDKPRIHRIWHIRDLLRFFGRAGKGIFLFKIKKSAVPLIFLTKYMSKIPDFHRL